MDLFYPHTPPSPSATPLPTFTHAAFLTPPDSRGTVSAQERSRNGVLVRPAVFRHREWDLLL
jgi:hypothetical protein